MQPGEENSIKMVQSTTIYEKDLKNKLLESYNEVTSPSLSFHILDCCLLVLFPCLLSFFTLLQLQPVFLFHVGRWGRRGGAYAQPIWPWQKSDDLSRAAISIIMGKLISWCIGLRVRLQGVQVLWGQWLALTGHGWRMAGRRSGLWSCEGGGCKCTISLAAAWCCSPCCHTSKQEQIKRQLFWWI